MKKLYFCLLVLLLSVCQVEAQVEIGSTLMLPTTEQGGFFHPQFAPDGSYLVTSTESYHGIIKHDLSTLKQQVLSSEQSAGFGLTFSRDSRSIYYRPSELRQSRRYTSIERVNTTTSSKARLTMPSRWPKEPKQMTDMVYLTVVDEGIVLHENGQDYLLAPLGEESYYWASLSPDGKHIVFSTAYHGTAITDIYGHNIVRLGRLNAPSWLGNDYVVGMQETDDSEGRVMTSKLVVRSIDGTVNQTLTLDTETPMYPSASADGKRLTYNNAKGQVFVTEITALRPVNPSDTPLTDQTRVKYVPQQKAPANSVTTALEGVKIYLNPGHGGFDSNDRSVWTIPVPAVWTDSAGYWESKSNFVKGLFLRKMLQDAGATVYFSRERNDSGARDIDEFRRKNPNATQHEIDSVMVGGDRDLSAIAIEANTKGVDHFLSIHSNALNSKTNYLLMLYHGEQGKPTVEHSDEMAAMAGGVQINNPLTTWTSPNPLIRGDITFYGDSPTDPLAGLGVLRPLTVPGHLSEGSFHDYAPETHRLMNKDYCHLEALRMYQYFHKWFQKELPGTATVSGYVKSANEKVDVLGQPKFFYLPNSDDQWLPINGAKVTLLDAAGEQELQSLITDDWYNGVFAFYDLEPGSYKVRAEKGGYKTQTVDVTVGANQISGTKIQLYNNHLDVPDYVDSDDDNIMALSEYEMEAVGSTQAVPGVFDRVIYRNGSFYALSLGMIAKIGVGNLGDMTKAQMLAMPNAIVPVDIAFTADNYLCALTIDGAIYVFDETDHNPTKVYESAELGQAFAVSGPLWKAKFYVVNNAKNGVVGVEYSDTKQMSEFVVKNFSIADLSLEGVRPMIMPNGQVYFDSPSINATAVAFDWTAGTTTLTPLSAPELVEEKSAYGANFFLYAHHSYMALPVCAAESKQVGMQLIDITNGFDKAQVVSAKYPEAGLGEASATYMTAMPFISGYDINIYLLAVGQGFQLLRTLNKPVAAIYAGEVNITDEKISFRLNEDALSVIISIESEGEITDSYDCGALKKGLNSIDNPFKDKEYDAINISSSARPIAYPQKFSTDDKQFHFFSPRGISIDRTPSSPFFGRIYVSETAGGLTSEGLGEQRTTTTGIYVLGSDFSDPTNQGDKAWTGNVAWGANNGTNYQMGVGRPSVAENGDVFITSSAFSSANVYIMNPQKPDSDFVAVFDGKRNEDTGALKKGAKVVCNPLMHCVVKGKGKNRVLYTMDRNNSLGTPYTNIMQYNIGEQESLPWAQQATERLYDDMNAGSYFQNGNGQLYSDQRGGWWMSQYRSDGHATTAVPSMAHISAQGKVDFNFGATLPGCHNGGMAVTADGNRVAIVSTGGVAYVYDIDYNSSNVPSLTQAYVIQWGRSADVVWSMEFDAAGNLYIVSNVNERLMAYSLPTATNTFNTRISFKEEEEPVIHDGVENIKTEVKVKGVYTVDGKYVGQTTDGLDHGVYIVNGEKIVK